MERDKIKSAVEFFDAWKDGEVREVMESRQHLQVIVDLARSVLDAAGRMPSQRPSRQGDGRALEWYYRGWNDAVDQCVLARAGETFYVGAEQLKEACYKADIKALESRIAEMKEKLELQNKIVPKLEKGLETYELEYRLLKSNFDKAQARIAELEGQTPKNFTIPCEYAKVCDGIRQKKEVSVQEIEFMICDGTGRCDDDATLMTAQMIYRRVYGGSEGK